MRYALNAVPINGSARLYGKSTALLISIGASGFSAKQKHASSAAVLVSVTAAGAGQMAKTAKSTALLAIDADAAGKLARRGETRGASIDVDAKHGIPNPMPRSPKIGDAHPSRVIIVQPDNRVIVVPREDREV